MTIKTLSVSNVNVNSKTDFPNGLTVSSGNVGIGTRTASYRMDVQVFGSGVQTVQRLLVNSSYFTFSSGVVTVDVVNKTGTIDITSSETYSPSYYTSFIYAGMILTATAGTSPVGNLGTMSAGTYVLVTGVSVFSNQLRISFSYPTASTFPPTAGNITSIVVSGYVAGWGPSLMFSGMGDGRELGTIKVLSEQNVSGGYSFMAFGTRNNDVVAEKMRISASGNVGIGTSNPAQLLHVAGRTLIGGATTNSIWDINADSMGINRNIETGAIYDATGYAYQWQHAKHPSVATSDTLYLSAWTPAGLAVAGGLTLNGAGNIGIGTTTPAALLGVNGMVQISSASPAWPTSGVGLELFYNSTGDIAQIQSYARTGSIYKPLIFDALRHEFRVSGTSKFIIDSTGVVDIVNDTAATSSTGALSVAGGIKITKASYFADKITINSGGMSVTGAISGSIASKMFLPAQSFNLPSSGYPTFGQKDTGSVKYELSYSGTVDQISYTTVAVPSSFSGTSIKFKLYYYMESSLATQKVAWQILTALVGDGSDPNPTLSTSLTINSTSSSTGGRLKIDSGTITSTDLSALTSAAEKILHIGLKRYATDTVNDTSTAAAIFLAMIIEF